ncbi:MAG TPA: 23S rRNA (guanosine(2251)-2'-O)-methyltransferase RlmB [Saprospiraceae bacterium]|nr:23S rRNA (guanosine(2251)-2'-O)-methyltransferase RlmB [Saprospiraceae bacterium]HMV23477.1 23S rRNA (guanosine(2251)-2'-O)-methyltransferase RlmB [Saprospiraceae bacterium]HMW75897.1 23S rRNA (guanosine(2251)-2'-O)-methyltransferase RlmB [Saprospiraceae bacterium]HMX83184.1 23S rRNA (guanosine(2251)-2'-O)-methyltransferase RlmB [Saprospiraceae bacterium]HMX85162.1 23S rRNA (guanosine(2251)-2'-O)-methyltransferase RlmB [Saprospiraceae bacterium]
MSNVNKNLLIKGRNPVLEALNESTDIERVYLLQGITGEFEKVLRHLCRKKEVPLQVIPKERMSRFVSDNHQGVVAIKTSIPYYNVEDIVAHCFENGKMPLIVILDEVTDVRNLGAIARSALSFGADALVVPTIGSAPIQADSIKASAGALLKVNVCRSASLVNTVKYLQDSGMTVIASSLEAKTPLDSLDLTVPLAVIVGSEDHGIREHLLRASDQRFIIPQSAEMESLNVSVAAGIMLYEVYKQRAKV